MENEKWLERLDNDMLLRAFAENSLEVYHRQVLSFLDFFQMPAENLNEEHIRLYSLHLIEKGLSTSPINQALACIRFFFTVTMNRPINNRLVPNLKMHKGIPAILSREEIGMLLSSCTNLKHKAMFALAYGSGLRVSEVCSIRVHDIHSKEMRVFVSCGKGNKDRYTILSQSCLEILRKYWKAYRPNDPNDYLFPGGKGRITEDAVEQAFKKWVKVAGISKSPTFHSLRHSFATHLLEDGVDIFTIKELLGHRSIRTTTIYLHTVNYGLCKVYSPLDGCV